MRHLALGESRLVHDAPRVAFADCGSDVILVSLARAVTHVRIDLVHFPIINCFAPVSDDASVTKCPGGLARFAANGMAPERRRTSGWRCDVAGIRRLARG